MINNHNYRLLNGSADLLRDGVDEQQFAFIFVNFNKETSKLFKGQHEYIRGEIKFSNRRKYKEYTVKYVSLKFVNQQNLLYQILKNNYQFRELYEIYI